MTTSKPEDNQENQQHHFPEDIEEDDQEDQQHHFHVLAVDDDLVDRKLLERLLTVSSYQVTCVESGDKALEYLGLLGNVDDHDSTFSSSSSSSSPPPEHEVQAQRVKVKVNLIMTDYSMPGMSGYDLLKRVKKSSCKDIPVVVMSSENVPSRINMCLEGGAEEFLLKPVQLSDLEKLQPHLLKSLTCKCNCGTAITTTDICSSSNDSGISINCNGDNSIENKRKAVSPEPSAERIPKLKGLTVM